MLRKIILILLFVSIIKADVPFRIPRDIELERLPAILNRNFDELDRRIKNVKTKTVELGFSTGTIATETMDKTLWARDVRTEQRHTLIDDDVQGQLFENSLEKLSRGINGEAAVYRTCVMDTYWNGCNVRVSTGGRLAITPSGLFDVTTDFAGLVASDNNYKLIVIDTYTLNVGAIFGGSTDGIGVSGYTDTNSGTGVQGYAESAGTGVKGESTSIGIGVQGVSAAGGTGVSGESDGTGNGVYGYNPDSDGYAGYFEGRVNVEGDFTCDAGTVPYSLKSGTATYAENVTIGAIGTYLDYILTYYDDEVYKSGSSPLFAGVLIFNGNVLYHKP